MYLVFGFISDLIEQLRKEMTNTFPLLRQHCLMQCLPFVTRHMSRWRSLRLPFWGPTSQIFVVSTISFSGSCGGKSIIRRSSMAAIYQREPLSPVSRLLFFIDIPCSHIFLIHVIKRNIFVLDMALTVFMLKPMYVFIYSC